MHVAVKDLLDILSREQAIYDQILALLETEQDCLVREKPSRVMELARQKEQLLLKIRNLEEARELVCLRLAREWKIPVSGFCLSRVEKHVDQETAARVATLRVQMQEVIEKIRTLNSRSRHLCEEGIKTIQDIIESARKEARQQTGPYAGPGAETSPRPRWNR